MMKIKYKDQILLEYAYTTVQEVYLDKQLFKPGSEKGLKGSEMDLNRNASQIGEEVADIKGNKIYIKYGMPYGKDYQKVTNVSAFNRDGKHIINATFYPYGRKDMYVAGTVERFNEGNIFASDIYYYLVANLGWTIQADRTHSDAGANLWKRMIRMYPDIEFSYMKWNGNVPDPDSPIDPKNTELIDSLWSTDSSIHPVYHTSIMMKRK
jgi:hypothetical protein